MQAIKIIVTKLTKIQIESFALHVIPIWKSWLSSIAIVLNVLSSAACLEIAANRIIVLTEDYSIEIEAMLWKQHRFVPVFKISKAKCRIIHGKINNS